MSISDFMNPSKITKRMRMGVKGAGGYALAAFAGQTAVKVFDMVKGNRFPQINSLENRVLLQQMPLSTGAVTVRDIPSLIPVITESIKLFTDKTNKSKHLTNAGAAYATKIAMRSVGYNPLPSESTKKEHNVKAMSYQLPQVY